MTQPTTLVLGATGKTGRRVAARLRLAGAPVRAASRSSRTPFDWSDPSGWSAALDGVRVVYLVPPGVPGPAHEFVARATAASVEHVVLLSGRGADTWGDSRFGLDMRSADGVLRGSSLHWTVLRPSNFAQNFDEDVFHAPLLAGELALPAGAVPEPFIDLEDVADVAATVIDQPDEYVGVTLELSGPRSVTFAEATDLIARASGRPITYRQVSPQEYAHGLVAEGVPEQDADHVAEMFVLMDRGIISTTTDTVDSVLGRPARTFEDYVLRTAARGAWDR